MRLMVNPDVVWAGEADQIRLYHGGLGEFRTLNRTGSEIWTLVVEGRSADEISYRLAEAYVPGDGDPPDVVHREVRDFLANLMTTGFIVKAETG